jgi:hypothetical protein
VDEWAAGVEADGRRFFHLVFTALRAVVDVIFALFFEILTLLLHVLRKV